MCSYDSLICPCPVVGDWVRIDQSQGDCSREHRCAADQVCPIEEEFLVAVRAELPRKHSRLIEILTGRI